MPYKQKKPKQVEVKEEIPGSSQERGLGMIGVKMACVDEKNAWNFKAKNALDAIDKAVKICKENGYHWPTQVVVWEFLRKEGNENK